MMIAPNNSFFITIETPLYGVMANEQVEITIAGRSGVEKIANLAYNPYEERCVWN
jgi:hypothetical protein